MKYKYPLYVKTNNEFSKENGMEKRLINAGLSVKKLI